MVDPDAVLSYGHYVWCNLKAIMSSHSQQQWDSHENDAASRSKVSEYFRQVKQLSESGLGINMRQNERMYNTAEFFFITFKSKLAEGCSLGTSGPGSDPV